MDAIRKEKKELEIQKQQLLDERNKLAQDREAHVIRVTDARLGDLWNYGAGILRAYKDVAETSQELWYLSKQVEPYRKWYKGKKIKHAGGRWYLPFPDPKEPNTDQQTEWGDYVIGGPDMWRCSKDYSYIFGGFDIEFDPQDSKPNTRQRAELVGKWQQDQNTENERLTAEYHVSCFEELEDTVRQRIEFEVGEVAFVIKDFSKELLQWEGVNNAGGEVLQRIREKLMEEISANDEFANLPIQLKITKGASLREIEKKADQTIVNIQAARDWLDKATSDRYTWTKD